MQSGAELEAILIAAKSVGLPFLVALPGMFLARGWSRRDDPTRRRWANVISTVFVVLGVLAGYAALNFEAWHFPPAQVMDWLPWLAIAAAAVLMPLEYFAAGKRLWFAAQVVLVGFSSWVMLPPATLEAGAATVASRLLPMTAAWLLAWRFLDAVNTPRQSGVALTCCAGALGFVVALGGSIVIGSASNSLMGALAAWLAIGVIGGWIPLPRALLGVAALWFGCMLFAAYFYAEMPPWLLGVVLLGLFSVRLARLATFDGERRRWRELALNAATAGVPLAVAVGYAVWNYTRQSNAY